MEFENQSYELAKKQLTQLEPLPTNLSDEQKNRRIMSYFKEVNSLDIEVPEEIYNLNGKSAEEKFNIAKETKTFNDRDQELLVNFTESIENNEFEKSLEDLKNKILASNFEENKFRAYNLVVNSLKLINDEKPELFSRRVDLDCALSAVGLVTAAVGLFTLTAASGGLAIGAAVVGYTAGSAAFVRACR